MPNSPTPSAKDKVLAWVRSKNPASMELKFGCKIYNPNFVEERRIVSITHYYHFGEGEIICDTTCGSVGNEKCRALRPGGFSSFEQDGVLILGSDLGLQELLIALKKQWGTESFRELVDKYGTLDTLWMIFVMRFDLTKNLHQQPDEFFESILPLIP